MAIAASSGESQARRAGRRVIADVRIVFVKGVFTSKQQSNKLARFPAFDDLRLFSVACGLDPDALVRALPKSLYATKLHLSGTITIETQGRTLVNREGQYSVAK